MLANPQGFWTLFKRETLRFISLPNQTLIPAVLSTVLYILVFGFFLGTHVDHIEGFEYIIFIFPGLLLMACVTASFQNATTTLFISRWQHFIEDLLVAPLSFWEVVAAFVCASILRGVLTGALCLLAGTFLIHSPLDHPYLLFLSLTASSAVFSAFGLIIGLWAERWDHIAIYQNYVLTPLVFLGGVFHSISILPEGFRWVNELNPLYYMVEGVRYSLLGKTDVSFGLSLVITVTLAFILLTLAVELFRRGYKLRT